ncbi:MAG: hypothetical protein KUG61_05790 [Parvibaculaceae bacterium]|nr:hypothetical protein [Parvibaculaceae bacterium]
MTELMVLLLTVAVGFVAAGLAGSIYQVATKKQISFQMWEENTAGLAMGVLALVVAGPNVILRNALRAQVIEKRPPMWLGLSAMISSMWSFLSGLFILNLLLI